MIEPKKDFSDRELLWFGPLFALFVGLLGLVLMRRLLWAGAAYGIWLAAAILIALYYLLPTIRKPIYRAWLYAVFPIGWVVSHVLIAVIFYLVLTPIAVLMKILGYDPMMRRFDPSAPTYWIDREPTVDQHQYFRQS